MERGWILRRRSRVQKGWRHGVEPLAGCQIVVFGQTLKKHRSLTRKAPGLYDIESRFESSCSRARSSLSRRAGYHLHNTPDHPCPKLARPVIIHNVNSRCKPSQPPNKILVSTADYTHIAPTRHSWHSQSSKRYHRSWPESRRRATLRCLQFRRPMYLRTVVV